MEGRWSQEFGSNGSSKGVVDMVAGCTGRRGHEVGAPPVETKATVAYNCQILFQMTIQEKKKTKALTSG